MQFAYAHSMEKGNDSGSNIPEGERKSLGFESPDGSILYF